MDEPIDFEFNGETFRAIQASPDFSAIELEGSSANIDPALFRGILLTLTVVDNETGEMFPHGSAVLACYNYCLCATHVIEEFKSGIEAKEQTVFFTGYVGQKVVMWQATQVVAIKGYDVAMVMIEPRFQSKDVGGVIACAVLDFAMPKIGDDIVITGTIPLENSYSLSDNKSKPPVMETRLCKGRVIDVYPDGRDRSMIPMPAFTVDAPSSGAMSGGPAFNMNGQLIGLISSSADNQPTTVSLIVSPESPSPKDMMKR